MSSLIDQLIASWKARRTMLESQLEMLESGDLAVPALLSLTALLVEHLGQLLDRLALPGCNLRRMQLVPGRQLCNRLVALDRLKRNLGFELSRKPSPSSSWWFTLRIGETTLARCLRNWDHLCQPVESLEASLHRTGP